VLQSGKETGSGGNKRSDNCYPVIIQVKVKVNNAIYLCEVWVPATCKLLTI